jgi:hypothetical protein
MARIGWLPMIGVLMLAVTARAEAAADPDAGAQVFGTSAACHTLEPGAHRTGPSLAGVLGRKARTASHLAWLLTYPLAGLAGSAFGLVSTVILLGVMSLGRRLWLPVAEQEGVTDVYVCRLLPLTCLAPDIVAAMLDGQQPKG